MNIIRIKENMYNCAKIDYWFCGVAVYLSQMVQNILILTLGDLLIHFSSAYLEINGSNVFLT